MKKIYLLRDFQSGLSLVPTALYLVCFTVSYSYSTESISKNQAIFGLN